MVADLRKVMKLNRHNSLFKSGRIEESLAEHRAIMAALLATGGELDVQIPGLRSFRGIDGARIKLPATPADLWLWLRGDDRGQLLIRSRHLETLLAPAFDVQQITDAFNHNQGGT
jgi:hypothetical protein